MGYSNLVLIAISISTLTIHNFASPVYYNELTNVTYTGLPDANKHPLTPYLFYNVTKCNLQFTHQQELYFPIPFLIGGAECWHIQQVDESSILQLGEFPVVDPNSEGDKKYTWVLGKYGEHRCQNTTEEIIASFVHKTLPRTRVNVVSTQVFGPIQISFQGILSFQGQNETKVVDGTYNGFEVLPSDFLLTTQHMKKDEEKC